MLLNASTSTTNNISSKMSNDTTVGALLIAPALYKDEYNDIKIDRFVKGGFLYARNIKRKG